MTQHRLDNETMALNALSSLTLKTSRDGDSTAFQDSPFQCLVTPSAKKFLIMSNLNLPWLSLILRPLVWNLLFHPPAAFLAHTAPCEYTEFFQHILLGRIPIADPVWR